MEAESTCNCITCETASVDRTQFCLLQPCGCEICVHCLLQLHSERGARPLKCPDCSEISTSHLQYRPLYTRATRRNSSGTRMGSNEETEIMHQPCTNFKLDKVVDCFRTFHRELNRNKTPIKSRLLYNVLYIIDPELGPKLTSVDFSLSGEGEMHPNRRKC